MAYDDSAENRLAAVRAAINRCLTSQEYSIAGRRQVSADLKQLRDAEKELIAEVNSASEGSSMCSLGIQDPPSQ